MTNTDLATITQAIEKTRRYENGSRFRADAMQILYDQYHKATGLYATYNELWDWLAQYR